MTVGDGAYARSAIEAFVEFLRQFAGPTGSRASILLMAGGLVVLGFLFMAFLFRSAVVGDIASNAAHRPPAPRALLPPDTPPRTVALPPTEDAFALGRVMGRESPPGLDDSLAAMASHGFGAPRLLRTNSESMVLRVYGRGPTSCEHVRGYLVGSLERALGPPVKVDEMACRSNGAESCDFIVRHPRREGIP